MEERWSDLLENELIPYAAARKSGQGIPIVIQEFGVTPFNRTSVVPWSIHPGESTGASGETLDPDEQRAVVRGLLRALDGHKDEIRSVHFWTWSFDSNRSDLFGLDPNQANNSQSTAIAIQDFLNS